MDIWAPAIVLGSIGSRRAGASKRRPRPRSHVVGDVYSAEPSNFRSSEMHDQFRSAQSSVCLPPTPLVARHDVDLVPTWTLMGAAVGASVLARSMSAQAEEQWRLFCQRDQHLGCSDRPQTQLQRLSRGVNMLLRICIAFSRPATRIQHAVRSPQRRTSLRRRPRRTGGRPRRRSAHAASRARLSVAGARFATNARMPRGRPAQQPQCTQMAKVRFSQRPEDLLHSLTS